MIYTRFGTEVELLAYCGKHQPKGFSVPLMLLHVRHRDDDSEGYQFAAFLKADGGINAIESAVDALPEVTLTGKALKAALKDAS